MTHPRRAMLMSVHPHFAEAILDGSKTVELRRRCVAAPTGTPVVLYATSPTKALVGTVEISSVHSAPPTELWKTHGAHTALSRDQHDDYLSGATAPCAITLTEPQRLPASIPLATLQTMGSFCVPQSYRYLDASTLKRIADTGTAGTQLLQYMIEVGAV